ncbi:hypothetical protein EDB81DRAFT_768545 [Dactylonectria macrodidyma]|uniref:Uncharacterized protein n=1 Tax=Dactylonectria macrodidyma TaxID=307937 RepID=A0A9P9I992_9HYPO|nr:hypothetical protein EDB81DRAFT_768545 [Dactylonectria macrodidyma]
MAHQNTASHSEGDIFLLKKCYMAFGVPFFLTPACLPTRLAPTQQKTPRSPSILSLSPPTTPTPLLHRIASHRIASHRTVGKVPTMSQVVIIANAQRPAPGDYVRQLAHDIHQIISYQYEYERTCETFRSHFGDVLSRFIQLTRHSNGYQSGLDMLIQLASSIWMLEKRGREVDSLKTEHTQSAKERLPAVHKAFVGATNDALLKLCKLRLALSPQESTAERDTAGGESNTAPDSDAGPEANPDPGKHMISKALATTTRLREVLDRWG